MKPIFLIGFPGCGKTTLGSAVNQATGMAFIDLDEAVEAQAGKSVTRIFAEDGETEFRRLEGEVLAQLCRRNDVLIATGGGTPCTAALMDMMLASGTVVWLTASRERLLTRLKEGRSKRPHIAQATDDDIARYIDTKLAERTPHYCRAHLRFDADRLDTVPEVAQTVESFVKTIVRRQ